MHSEEGMLRGGGTKNAKALAACFEEERSTQIKAHE
jgi:hypothetical protein